MSGTRQLADAVLKPIEQMFGIEGRVIAVLIENPEGELTKKDLLRLADISQTFLNGYYERLKEAGAIKVTKKVGRVEFFMPNLDNELLQIIEKWYLEKLKEKELERAKKIYEKYYKGKETAEDKALVELFIHYEKNGTLALAKIKKEILEKLEKQGMLLSKEKNIYFTQRGYDIAKSLLEFQKEVVCT